MKKWRGRLLVLWYAGLLAACDRAPQQGAGLSDDANVLARGQAVYAQHCASCHGARLEGQPNWRERDANGLLPAPPHDASGHTWHHPDDALLRITKYGVAKAANLPDYQSAMPAYKQVLGDEDIVAVLSWIRAQWPARIREQQAEVNAQALQNAARRAP